MRVDRIGWTYRALAVIALGSLLGSATPAQAAFIIDFNQVGDDVVVTGSGTLDVTDLNGPTPNSFFPVMQPQFAQIATGASGLVDVYSGIAVAPANFGPGGASFANSGSGDLIFINPAVLEVPRGYVSGAALSNISTYNQQTFATMGLTPGTYVYSWGSGDHADTLTLNINAAVPEPATLTLLGCAVLGFAARRRYLRPRS